MFDKLQTIETRYDKLMALVSDPGVQADPNQYRTHAKALAEIQPTVDRFREYKTVVAEIAQNAGTEGGPRRRHAGTGRAGAGHPRGTA